VVITQVGGLRRREGECSRDEAECHDGHRHEPARRRATATKSKGHEEEQRPSGAPPRALAYFALVFTGLLVLAEPWLLIPVAALALAVSLWD
jgi:hypothetical protein